MPAAPHAGPLEPLATLYEAQGLSLPSLSAILPEDMPQPYRRLLVHTEAMTPTLEDFFGQRLDLRVLEHSIVSTTLVRRQVVLAGARDERPVEFGAIRINLTCFDEQPRELLRQGRVPMGRILGDFQIAYACHPILFFQVEPDGMIRQSLALGSGAHELFGRCNRILTPDGRVIADVVEMLAPVREAQLGRTRRAG